MLICPHLQKEWRENTGDIKARGGEEMNVESVQRRQCIMSAVMMNTFSQTYIYQNVLKVKMMGVVGWGNAAFLIM